MFWAHRCNFLATIELLLTGLRVHDDSQGSNHVDSLALGRVPQILLAVCGPVSVNVFDLKFSLRCLLGGLLKTKKELDDAYVRSTDDHLLTSSGMTVCSSSKLHQAGAPNLAFLHEGTFWLIVDRSFEIESVLRYLLDHAA